MRATFQIAEVMKRRTLQPLPAIWAVGEDKKGNIWQPDTSNHGKNRENGSEEHWDVQRKDGKGYRNVGKDRKTWGGKGKAPNLPKKEEEKNTDNADIGNAIGTGALGLAGGNTRMGSWKMVACPCYCAH